MTRPMPTSETGIKVFSTCCQSSALDRQSFMTNVIDVARWSEEAGCEGILIYTDNSLVDPWLVAQIIIQNTKRLCPLVAIQPAYMHPYSVAKMVASLGHLYGRRLYLNMVAGGFKNDLTALGDTTAHDRRYARLVEYTTVIKELLRSDGPVTYRGEFYSVDKLRMTPPLDSALFPGIVVSGSSEAGIAAAVALGAVAVKYAPPPEVEAKCQSVAESGMRVGLIARDSETEAWKVARERFPGDRKGQLSHQLAMKTSDSNWHQQLSELAEASKSGNGPFWLWPFENYNTFCPYLVGSYEQVATELGKYLALGFRTFILDIPSAEDELKHINVTFARAHQLVSK
jgi:alkanesulfonate monooxygenase